MPHVQVNDLSMYYEIQGTQGSPLLLIMGLGASQIEWPPAVVEKLATQHRVILFDNRGIGQTVYSPEPYTLLQLATDAVTLLDVLKIEKAHIFGISMGGMIAQHLVLHYPTKVMGLVLGCTTAGKPDKPILVSPTKEVLSILTRPASDNRAQMVRENWHIAYTSAFVETRQAYLEERLQRVLAYPSPRPDAYKQQIGAIIHSHDTFSRLQTITQPVLVQTGSEDKIIPPQNATLLAEQIPNAQLIVYPNAGHVYLEEANPQATEDILTFLQQVEMQ
jgi:pimeloyl-ACP methyl ester carboxylesterase